MKTWTALAPRSLGVTANGAPSLTAFPKSLNALRWSYSLNKKTKGGGGLNNERKT